MAWYVLINANGDPASLTTVPITDPPAGCTVKAFDGDDQPDVSTWADPIRGRLAALPRPWDRATQTWGAAIPPTLVDRLDDLAADGALVDAWQRLTVAQRTALRARLGKLLGRYRWRYGSAPIDMGG